MIVADKWLVLEDGCVMNIDTGAILWQTKNKEGHPCFKLLDDTGKTHFFLKSTLMDMKKEEMMIEKAYAHRNDLFEWEEFLPIERLSEKPKIVEEFKEILAKEQERTQRELKYAIQTDKPKEVKIQRKKERDNVKTIIDFIGE